MEPAFILKANHQDRCCFSLLKKLKIFQAKGGHGLQHLQEYKEK